MKPHVYIFRGAPASGKGTLVPEFAKTLPKPIVLIEQDKLRWGFHLIGRTVEEIGPEEHRLAYENTLLLYEKYLGSGKFTVVIEGLFTWGDTQSNEGDAKQLLELAQQYGFEATSIVLTADKEQLLDRNRQRSYSVPTEEFEMLYEGVHRKIDANEIVIDTTNKSTDDTITKLKALVVS